jgi:hypothetical protein
MPQKECCNLKCNAVFHIEKHKFFQKDLCDDCADNEKKEDQDPLLRNHEALFRRGLDAPYSVPEVVMLLKDYCDFRSPLLPAYKKIIRKHSYLGEYAKGLKAADKDLYEQRFKEYKALNKLKL